jgi:type I restriction enzyme S subunit
MSPAAWPELRSRFIFQRRDVRGVDAPLASATKEGVSLRDDLNISVWNPESDVSNYKLVEPGDFVIGLRSFQHGISHSEVRGIVSPAYTVLRGTSVVDARFYKYYFRSTILITQLANITQGIRQGQTIDTAAFADLRIPVPPLQEQCRIADFLDAETARIDSFFVVQRQARTVLLEHRAANVFSAVTGNGIDERVPSRLAWVDTLPAPWQSIKLGHIARMGSGHTPSRSHAEWWENCTIPWITTGEVSQVRDDRREVLTETRESISEIGMANSAAELHPKGTVALCRTASAGYSAVMGEDMATSQDFVTWTCGPQLDPFYLLWCLRAMRTDLLGRLAMGSTHKTIYVPDLQALRIPLPPLADQRRIVTDIRASNATIDAAVDALDRQAALLAERRRALVTAATTGEIDVTTAGGIAV